jgi:nucleoside-diphosphate-sugar epimerase
MDIFATGTTGTIGKYLKNSVHPIQIELEHDFELPPELLKNNNFALIHLGGIVGVQAVSKDTELAYRINVTATRHLAEKCIQSGVKKFIYVSTSHVYKSSVNVLDENCETYPTTKYAEQKRLAEIAVLEAFKDAPERLVVARVFSVLDWGTPEFTLGGAVLKLLNGKISNINSGMDLRDFLTPKKVASVLLEVATCDQLFGIVNICSSKPISISDAVGKMLSESGRSDLIGRVIPDKSTNPAIVGSNQKLLNALPHLELTWAPSQLEN